MTLILTNSDIEELIDRPAIYRAVEQAHADLSTGAASNPAPPQLPLPDEGTAIPMVASSKPLRASVVKMLSDMPHNGARGMPSQRSTILLMSAQTGECEAVLDGRLITAVRTSAASAVATAHLAPRHSSILGLIGAGTLAVEHTRAISRIRQIEKVHVWSRSTSTVDLFRERIADLDLEIEYTESPRDVLSTADIVCTLTPSRVPIVEGAWFRPGLHLNAVGAPPRADHREIDGRGMGGCRLVVDSTPTVLTKSGDVLLAIAEGHLAAEDINVELGDVIVRPALGRRTDDDITLFKSVGIGLQDLVTARSVVDAALQLGTGSMVCLSA
jgi:alanine dehydrogenase